MEQNPLDIAKAISDYGPYAVILGIVCIASVLCCVWLGNRIGRQMAYYFVADSNTFLAVCFGVSSFLFFKSINSNQN